MNNSGKFDKFASRIIPYCKPTASELSKLQSCPFVTSDGLPSSTDNHSSSEQVTGIIILSMPDTSDDDYQTPPEHHHSQNSGNEGHVPATAAAEADDVTEEVTADAVDLGNDTENIVLDEDNDDTLIVEEDDTEENKAEDYSVDETEVIEDAHHVFDEMPERENEESVSEKMVETDLNREKRRLPPSMMSKKGGSGGEGGECSKREAFKDNIDRVLKMLCKEGKGAGGGGGHGEGRRINFIETAKRRGMTFPRPRWWSAERGKE